MIAQQAQKDETVAIHDDLWSQRVRITSAKLHELWSPDYHDRIQCGTALALEPESVKVSGGRWRVKDKDGKWQTVNGQCTCDDYKGKIPGQAAAPKGFCMHRFSALIVRDAQAIPDEELHSGPETVDQETGEIRKEALPEEESIDPDQDAWEREEAAPLTIPPQFIQMVHGKAHILYKGLLAMAHAKGLTSLEARFTLLEEKLAVAEAKATFKDGTFFVESADATEANISNPSIRPHFRRIALTRSKARALRDALNIGIVAVEEL